MVTDETEMGFTIIEVIVTLIVLSIFLTIFFGLFQTSESQRVIVTRRAAASDIAQSNLRKVTTADIPACAAGSNDPGSSGSQILDVYGGADASKPIKAENVSQILPSGTIQELRVFYTKACATGSKVVLVKSIVNNFGSEAVTHATYFTGP